MMFGCERDCLTLDEHGPHGCRSWSSYAVSPCWTGSRWNWGCHLVVLHPKEEFGLTNTATLESISKRQMRGRDDRHISSFLCPRSLRLTSTEAHCIDRQQCGLVSRMLGVLSVIQLVTIVSIPLSLVTIAFGRTSMQKPLRLRDTLMAIQFASIPALVILSVRRLFPWWAGGGGILLIAVLAFVQGMNTD